MTIETTKLDNSEKMIALQGLRAVSALAIAFAHMHHVFARHTGTISFGSFGFAVDVFFVISGFIMLHREWDHFGERGAQIRFFLRRLVRIAPLYFIVSLIYLFYVLRIPGLETANLNWDVVWKSFLFIPAQRPQGAVQPLLDVGWTLNYEMFFYACFALALLLSRALGLVAIVGCFVALNVAGAWLSLSTPIAFWANLRLFEFLAGMGLAFAFRRMPVGLRDWVCGGLVFGGVLVWQLALSTHWWIQGYSDVVKNFDPAVINLVPATMIVAGTVFYRKSITGFIKIIALTLGNASYGIYLIHPLTYYYTPWFFGFDYPEHNWGYMLFALAVVIVVAIFVHRFIEAPLIRLLTRPNKRSGRSMQNAAPA